MTCAATTLTSWHLLVTFCSFHVARRLKLFEHKPFDRKAVVGFGILNGISIGLLNLSLGFNSVGFYQVYFAHPLYFDLFIDVFVLALMFDLFIDVFVLALMFDLFIDVFILVLMFDLFIDVSAFQMTKLAIIPCTVLLETLSLAKRFRFSLIYCHPFSNFKTEARI